MNAVDKIVSYFSPARGMDRLRLRASYRALDAAGYITPGANRRSVRAWNPIEGTPDQDTLNKLRASRAGCRDLAMNSPIGRAALKRELTNVVGWGLNYQSRIDREILGMSNKTADAWERKTEREFRLWGGTSECDAARTLNFHELQAQALYNTSLSGDVFVLMPYIRRSNQPYQLRIKIVEGDYVCNPNGVPQTNKMAGGIEVDSYGAPKKYWFKKIRADQLLNVSSYGLAGSDWVSLNAYGTKSGRKQVLHLFHQERPGQRRGMPMLAPVVEVLKQITRLSEAELMAAVIASFFTVFVKTQPALGGLTDSIADSVKVTDESANDQDANVYEMGNGNIIELGGEGQDITIADPKRPNEAFAPFFEAMVKQIGSSLEIPYEQLILHFDASYSAARGAMLEAWKFYRHRRIWLSHKFCQPILENWMDEAVIRGRIVAPGYFEDPILRQAWLGSFWSGPGQGQIDPLKETQAADLKIQRYLSTYETEYAAIHGDDWTSGLNRNEREIQMIRDKDLPLPQPNSLVTTAEPAAEEPIDKG